METFNSLVLYGYIIFLTIFINTSEQVTPITDVHSNISRPQIPPLTNSLGVYTTDGYYRRNVNSSIITNCDIKVKIYSFVRETLMQKTGNPVEDLRNWNNSQLVSHTLGSTFYHGGKVKQLAEETMSGGFFLKDGMTTFLLGIPSPVLTDDCWAEISDCVPWTPLWGDGTNGKHNLFSEVQAGRTCISLTNIDTRNSPYPHSLHPKRLEVTPRFFKDAIEDVPALLRKVFLPNRQKRSIVDSNLIRMFYPIRNEQESANMWLKDGHCWYSACRIGCLFKKFATRMETCAWWNKNHPGWASAVTNINTVFAYASNSNEEEVCGMALVTMFGRARSFCTSKWLRIGLVRYQAEIAKKLSTAANERKTNAKNAVKLGQKAAEENLKLVKLLNKLGMRLDESVNDASLAKKDRLQLRRDLANLKSLLFSEVKRLEDMMKQRAILRDNQILSLSKNVEDLSFNQKLLCYFTGLLCMDVNITQVKRLGDMFQNAERLTQHKLDRAERDFRREDTKVKEYVVKVVKSQNNTSNYTRIIADLKKDFAKMNETAAKEKRYEEKADKLLKEEVERQKKQLADAADPARDNGSGFNFGGAGDFFKKLTGIGGLFGSLLLILIVGALIWCVYKKLKERKL